MILTRCTRSDWGIPADSDSPRQGHCQSPRVFATFLVTVYLNVLCCLKIKSLAMTYSSTPRGDSTIGAEELNFRVRYGNGWDLFAIVTRHNSQIKKTYRQKSKSFSLRDTRKNASSSSSKKSKLTMIRKDKRKIWSSLSDILVLVG